MNKRILFLLLGLLLFSFLGVNAATFDDGGTIEIDLLTQLGILEGETAKNFYPEDKVEKSELVSILLRLRGLTPQADGKQYFKDVPPDYYAAAHIHAALLAGLIPAGEYFYPDTPATVEDTAAMLLKLMNYRNYTEARQVTYTMVANEKRLFSGVHFQGDFVTKGQLAKIIYNSFSVPLLEVASVGNDGSDYRESEDTTLSFLGLKKVKGVVTANEISAMLYSGDPAPKGMVKIEDTLYLEGTTNGAALLGRYTEAYCTDQKEDVETLVYLGISSQYDSLEIAGEDILDVSDGQVYYKRGSREQKVRISGGMCMIYNGSAVRFDETLIAGAKGKVIFASNGKEISGLPYDVVIIQDYDSFMVQSVDVEKQRIYFKKGLLLGKPYLEADNDNPATVIKDGSPIAFDQIKMNDVVSVYSSIGEGRNRMTIQVSEQQVTLNVDQLDKEENCIVSSGRSYDLAENCIGTDLALPGEVVLARLDYLGEVVQMEKAEQVNYAYVLKKYHNEMRGVLELRLLTADGKINTYETKNKISITKGTEHFTVTQAKLMEELDQLEEPLIVIDLDADGKVSGVTLAVEAKEDDVLFNDTYFTNHGKVTTSTVASYGVIGTVGTFDTKVFLIPEEDETGAIEEKYCKVGNYFSAGTYYQNYWLYDIGLSGAAGAAVRRGQAGQSIDNWDINPVLVSKVQQVCREDGTIATAVKGYNGTSAVSLTIAEDAVNIGWPTSYDIYDVKPGDLFVYTANTDGEIGAYGVVYMDNKDKGNYQFIGAIGSGYGNTREFTAHYGKADYLSDTHLTMRYGSTAWPIGKSGAVWVYKVNRTTGKVTPSDLSAVIPTNFYNKTEGSEIVTISGRNDLKGVVIYENE